MSEDVRLLKTEMNLVFELVRSSGLDASSFEWSVEKITEYYPGGALYHTGSVLTHRPSQFFFRFGKYGDEFSPGLKERVEGVDYNHTDKWRRRVDVVFDWLSRLKEEVDAPDLWYELLKDRQLFQITSAAVQPGVVFTAEEKHYVSRQLNEIKDQIASVHDLQSQQVHALEQGFADLVEAMDRFGKKDWLNLAMGTLLNIAVATAFSPAAANYLLHRFIGAVGTLFGAAVKLIS